MVSQFIKAGFRESRLLWFLSLIVTTITITFCSASILLLSFSDSVQGIDSSGLYRITVDSWGKDSTPPFSPPGEPNLLLTYRDASNIEKLLDPITRATLTYQARVNIRAGESIKYHSIRATDTELLEYLDAKIIEGRFWNTTEEQENVVVVT